MARIRLTCPACGFEQDLPPGDIELIVAPVEHELPAAYGFTCRGCAHAAIRTADSQALEVLLAAGVDPAGGPRNTRFAHPEAPPAGPPLTLDDLLDLHLLLAGDTWFAHLREASSDG